MTEKIVDWDVKSKENKKKCKHVFLNTHSIYCFITQPSIYGVIVYFLLCQESLTINLAIDWHYTMAWLPASLLKTHRRLSKCATTMRIQFVYERRRYATMVKIRHGLATLNSNNSVVYGQKHKVWVLLFLVRTSGTF